MFGFVPDVNKLVEVNMGKVLRRRIEAVYFNECNNMSFHDLSRDKVATATHSLTSFLGLGPKFPPKVNRVSFRKFVINDS